MTASYAHDYGRVVRYAADDDRLRPLIDHPRGPASDAVLWDFLDDHHDPRADVFARHLGQTAYAGPGWDEDRVPVESRTVQWRVRPGEYHTIAFHVTDPHEPVDPDAGYFGEEHAYPRGRPGAVYVAWYHNAAPDDVHHGYRERSHGGLFTPDEALAIAHGLGDRGEPLKELLRRHFPGVVRYARDYDRVLEPDATASTVAAPATGGAVGGHAETMTAIKRRWPRLHAWLVRGERPDGQTPEPVADETPRV